MTDLNLAATVTDGGGSRTFVNPERANDGNIDTTTFTANFVSDPGTHTSILRTDLGSATTVGGMVVYGSVDNTSQPFWDVEYSADGSSWTPVTGLSRVWELGVPSETLTFDAHSARYWRIRFTIISYALPGFVTGVTVPGWEISAGTPAPPAPPKIEIEITPPGESEGTIFANPKDATIRIVLNAAGEGTIVLDRNDPQATADILKPGSLCSVTIPEIDPDPIFAFFLENGDWDLVSSDEEGGEELRFSGPGILWILHRAVIDWIEYEDGIGLPKPAKGYWEFLANDTEGHILNKLLREATSASRPQHPIAGVTWDFDSVGDSSSPPEDWDNVVFEGKWRVPIGAYLYDEVIRLVSSGLMSVEMDPDAVLHAYRTRGADRSGADYGPGVIRFVHGTYGVTPKPGRPGDNIVDELVRSQDGRDFASHGLGRYGDGDYTRAPKDGTWPYVQERFFDGLQTTHENTAKRMMKGNLGWMEAAQDVPLFAHVVPWPGRGHSEDDGIYLPGPDWSENGLYWVGDLVTLHTGTDELDYDEYTGRVAAITLRMDETGYLAPPIVELGASYGLGANRSSGGGSTVASPGGQSSGGSGSSGGSVDLSGYQRTAEKGADDGYAGLDDDGLVPIDQLGTGGDASGDNVLHDDGTWSPGGETIPAHTYELANEGGDPLVHAHGTTGATETIDPTDGNVHTLTLDDDCALTVLAPSGASGTLELWITQDPTGGWGITWPGSVTLVGTLDTTADTTSIVILTTADTGTSWVAAVVGSGGSGRTPATTVESETTFGITPAVGTDTEYARQDHTHGSPANPVTADAVRDAGRWELAVIPGAPPTILDDGSDFLYIWVPG